MLLAHIIALRIRVCKRSRKVFLPKARIYPYFLDILHKKQFVKQRDDDCADNVGDYKGDKKRQGAQNKPLYRGGRGEHSARAAYAREHHADKGDKGESGGQI